MHVSDLAKQQTRTYTYICTRLSLPACPRPACLAGCRQALAVLEAALGAAHPAVTTAVSNVISLLRREGKDQEVRLGVQAHVLKANPEPLAVISLAHGPPLHHPATQHPYAPQGSAVHPLPAPPPTPHPHLAPAAIGRTPTPPQARQLYDRYQPRWSYGLGQAGDEAVSGPGASTRGRPPPPSSSSSCSASTARLASAFGRPGSAPQRLPPWDADAVAAAASLRQPRLVGGVLGSGGGGAKPLGCGARSLPRVEGSHVVSHDGEPPQALRRSSDAAGLLRQVRGWLGRVGGKGKGTEGPGEEASRSIWPCDFGGMRGHMYACTHACKYLCRRHASI